MSKIRGSFQRTPNPIRLVTHLSCLALLLTGCDADILPPETDLATHNRTGTGSAMLSWQPPTERVDGSPLTRLSGYRIFYG